MYDYNGGWIEVITGPMYAGKTEELIRRITRVEIAGHNLVVFKPNIDDRYKEDKVVSHNGNEVESHTVEDAIEIENLVFNSDKKYDVVAIDEIQFIDDEYMTDIIDNFANNGIRVIVTGLDMDFRAEPFGLMPDIIAMAEEIDKFTAICNKCGKPATRTQRLIDGKPASKDDPTILVGSKESYEARCRKCHEVR